MKKLMMRLMFGKEWRMVRSKSDGSLEVIRKADRLLGSFLRGAEAKHVFEEERKREQNRC